VNDESLASGVSADCPTRARQGEQPFTRDLYGVKIPPGVTRVTVRARHKPKGYDGAALSVALPQKGE
jgi:hypothetical protein